MTATITVKRPHERVAVLRAYRVLLDGHEVGRLRPGDRVVVQAAAGSHILEARVDFNRTSMSLEMSDGEEVAVACRAGTTNPLTLWANLFRRRREWLRLELEP